MNFYLFKVFLWKTKFFFFPHKPKENGYKKIRCKKYIDKHENMLFLPKLEIAEV